ncbi:MAG: 4-hydroxythreonine-4-phosphate dehydrogenase PdxA [Akkermansiaceae bacterium]|nr:4-hydroxythreonine-4-phosphate dehydrogenase PdxA [Akkermansiaceae bacterium]
MPRIAVTLGDPAGIGPEVVDAAMKSGLLPKDVEWQRLGTTEGVLPGQPDETSAKIALDALQEATRLLTEGEVDGVVTGPVSKDGLQGLGFGFPGQTEFFAGALNTEEYGMLLTGDHLSVGLATIHEPLSRVASLLDAASIVRIGKLTATFIQHRKLGSPRIAVCGLNPHAGEQGRFGDEEERIIAPAIAELNALHIGEFSGPHVPDAVFREAAQGHFDAVIAMYHDQGLIPLKLLDFESAVNVTLGLPKPRTSPDHGTAYDIAGKGIANPSSMIAAMKLCAELCVGQG